MSDHRISAATANTSNFSHLERVCRAVGEEERGRKSRGEIVRMYWLWADYIDGWAKCQLSLGISFISCLLARSSLCPWSWVRFCHNLNLGYATRRLGY